MYLPIEATLQSGQKPETQVYCLKGASSRRRHWGHVWDQHCEKGRLGLCPGVNNVKTEEYRLCYYCVFMSVIWMKNSKYGSVYQIVIFKIYKFWLVQDKSGEFVSVLQCNNAPSSRTPRGHQFPAAFMMQVNSLPKLQWHININSTRGYQYQINEAILISTQQGHINAKWTRPH